MSAELAPLRAYIRRHEAPKGYNQVYGGIKAKDLPPRPLTQMKVREVLAWQDRIDARYPSEAAGAYQIMEDTLRAMVSHGKADPDALFDARTQDALADELMRGRGLDSYLSGKWSAERFCNALAMEWASLPVVTPVERVKRNAAGKVVKKWTVPAGASYYSGDGLNKALTSTDEFLRVVRAIRETRPNIVPTPQAAPPRPKSAPRATTTAGAVLAAAAAALALWWAGVKASLCALPIISIICGG
ncbi:hypothetical protein OEW28_18570 [Defluviimonas sp. WL0002]|uniref:Uncharacterized protein n=1 Tax=Albidovulum marisflavi TaxID=2984159 RepID=A0ABT2ZHN5_9RHOB|nr:hypothetical protein [Defluviimonas sp. WL0002]MCV2870621.1 hypothetical protein [Defluviimonas sp. WL0002]